MTVVREQSGEEPDRAVRMKYFDRSMYSRLFAQKLIRGENRTDPCQHDFDWLCDRRAVNVGPIRSQVACDLLPNTLLFFRDHAIGRRFPMPAPLHGKDPRVQPAQRLLRQPGPNAFNEERRCRLCFFSGSAEVKERTRLAIWLTFSWLGFEFESKRQPCTIAKFCSSSKSKFGRFSGWCVLPGMPPKRSRDHPPSSVWVARKAARISSYSRRSPFARELKTGHIVARQNLRPDCLRD